MVESILISDQGVGDAAQIEESIPIGVIAGHPGNLDGKDYADMTQCDLGGHRGKTAPIRCPGS
jgi:hypothetical protein